MRARVGEQGQQLIAGARVAAAGERAQGLEVAVAGERGELVAGGMASIFSSASIAAPRAAESAVAA